MASPPAMNIAICVLMFCTWAVQLGAAAAFQDEWDTTDAMERTLWWPVWFQFGVFIVYIASIAAGKMDEWKGVLVAFAAMCSAYLMPVAENYLAAIDACGCSSDRKDILRTSAAGTIMVICVNWLCIILYGNDSFREMVAAKAEEVVAKSEPTA